MVNWESKRLHDLLVLAIGLVLAVVINQLSSLYFFRADLTEEKRYSIQASTRDLLEKLDDDVYVEVFLEGDLNAGFRRLRKGVEETLEEFRIHSGNKVHYKFTDPATAAGQNARNEFMTLLASKGIQPTNVIDSKNGQRTEKLVFPGALVSYAGGESGVMLLKGNRALRSEEVLNQSIEGIEFQLASTIYKLSFADRKKVGLLSGHGELDSLEILSLQTSLSEVYDVIKVDLENPNDVRQLDVLVIAKPTRNFSESDKYKLDQYILRGGRVLFLLDRLRVSVDSVSRDDYFALPYSLGIDDQLFRYGVRVNPDLLLDRVALRYPVVTGVVDGKPQMTPIEWPFMPLINHYSDHPITRNLDVSVLKFASSIDTVKAAGVKKTPLMFSSDYSRRMTAPVKVTVNDLRNDKAESFTERAIPVAYLLEGRFISLYKNRFLPAHVDSVNFVPEGNSRMIVVGDGDIARNEVSSRSGQSRELGFDAFSGYTFANKDLLMNMVAFLSDEGGLINARSKDIKIRPLDKERIKNERMMWQVINVALPVLLVIGIGMVKVFLRKRKYTRFVIS